MLRWTRLTTSLTKHLQPCSLNLGNVHTFWGVCAVLGATSFNPDRKDQCLIPRLLLSFTPFHNVSDFLLFSWSHSQNAAPFLKYYKPPAPPRPNLYASSSSSSARKQSGAHSHYLTITLSYWTARLFMDSRILFQPGSKYADRLWNFHLQLLRKGIYLKWWMGETWRFFVPVSGWCVCLWTLLCVFVHNMKKGKSYKKAFSRSDVGPGPEISKLNQGKGLDKK